MHHIVTGREVIQKEKIIVVVVVVALYTDFAKKMLILALE
jgi:hypothetical protein